MAAGTVYVRESRESERCQAGTEQKIECDASASEFDRKGEILTGSMIFPHNHKGEILTGSANFEAPP